MKTVCIGDSFVKGHGLLPKDRWSNVLGDRLQSKLQAEMVNKGISGDTTGGMLARFFTDVIAEKPAMVFLCGGFNDCLCGAPCGSITANMMAMIHSAYHNHILPVVIISPCGDERLFRQHWPAAIDYKAAAEDFEQYRKALTALCRNFSVFYIDLYELAASYDANEIYLDGIHLNEKGHRIVAETMMQKLADMQLLHK